MYSHKGTYKLLFIKQFLQPSLVQLAKYKNTNIKTSENHRIYLPVMTRSVFSNNQYLKFTRIKCMSKINGRESYVIHLTQDSSSESSCGSSDLSNWISHQSSVKNFFEIDVSNPLINDASNVDSMNVSLLTSSSDISSDLSSRENENKVLQLTHETMKHGKREVVSSYDQHCND